MRRGFLHAGWSAISVSAWVALAAARAQTSYPMTLYVDPIAVSRGQTVEITISGRENFSGAWKLLCEGPGLRGEVRDSRKGRAEDQGPLRRAPAGDCPGSSPARGRPRRTAGPARAARGHAAGRLERRARRRRRRPGRRRNTRR